MDDTDPPAMKLWEESKNQVGVYVCVWGGGEGGGGETSICHYVHIQMNIKTCGCKHGVLDERNAAST